MAVYALSPASIANNAAKLRKIRIWGSIILVPLMALFLYLRISHSSTFGRSTEVAFIVLFVTLMTLVQPYPWRLSSRKVAAKMGDFCIEITSDAVEIRSSQFIRRIARDEIVRIEEPSWGGGFYVRTPNRYRWILIPRTLERFEEIKSGLAASGIPIVRTMIPPNWEEFLFVLLFCGSVACDLFATSRLVLFVNLGVALLLGVLGFLVTATTENSRLRFKARLGSLIPLVAACLTLLLRFARF